MEKGSSSSSSDSLNGLTFGKKIYFEGAGSGLRPSKAVDGLPPARSPAKRGRSGVVQGGQPPRCQVEGCKVDLSDAKAYYCRHKVCGMHSKSPKVIVAGLEQRFCQQCSRFHQLPEFDQGKRSCRRRLAGHNERRRKPPPGPILSSHYGSLSPSTFDNCSRTGGLVMDFSTYPTFTGSNSWPNAAESGKYQVPWQGNSQNPQPDLLQGSTTLPGYCGAGVSSVDSLIEVSESSSALSLLSNQLWGSTNQSSSIGTNHFLENNSAAVVQPSTNPGASIGQFSCQSWGFKVNKTGNTLHEMATDVAAQIPVHSNGQQSGDLGLGQPSHTDYHELVEHPRDYDSSIQHMQWSL